METTNIMTQEAYQEKLYETIKKEEGAVGYIYTDIKGIPTVGIGYALATKNKDTNKYTLISKDEVQNKLNYKFSDEEWSRLQQTIDHINSGDVQGAKALIPSADKHTNNFGFTLDDTQMKNLFDDIKTTYENRIPNTDKLAYSDERIAVFSVAYTGAYGNNLKEAMNNEDSINGRIRAWYEIRYRSNKDGKHTERRNEESDLFGLWRDGKPTAEELKKFIDFLKKSDPYSSDKSVYDVIKGYEDSYGAKNYKTKTIGEQYSDALKQLGLSDNAINNLDLKKAMNDPVMFDLAIHNSNMFNKYIDDIIKANKQPDTDSLSKYINNGGFLGSGTSTPQNNQNQGANDNSGSNSSSSVQPPITGAGTENNSTTQNSSSSSSSSSSTQTNQNTDTNTSKTTGTGSSSTDNNGTDTNTTTQGSDSGVQPPSTGNENNSTTPPSSDQTIDNNPAHILVRLEFVNTLDALNTASTRRAA